MGCGCGKAKEAVVSHEVAAREQAEREAEALAASGADNDTANPNRTTVR